MIRAVARAGAALLCIGALAACGQEEGGGNEVARNSATPEPETVDIPQTVSAEAPGTTPMRDRVAVVGLLNKRNGLSRDLTLKPGQAVRVGDVIVRLRACETSAPWEVQRLTGAFVQLDVRNPQGRFQRVFSGWLYKETPSLNVLEHPIYDVWPRSCAMTHPEAGESTVPASSNASSAPKSGRPASSRPAPARRAAPEPAAAPTAESSNAT